MGICSIIDTSHLLMHSHGVQGLLQVSLEHIKFVSHLPTSHNYSSNFWLDQPKTSQEHLEFDY